MSADWISKNVSRETFSRLEQYVALLQKWNKAINLIGKSTERELWDRHIADCLQLVSLLPANATVADLGSGGGLPGLVLAIARPDIAITLIEQDQRKAAFLQEVAARLQLTHATVKNSAIEAVDTTYPVVTARALASLKDLFALAYPRLRTGSICLFPKGRNFATEIQEAHQDWTFAHELIPSQTQDASSIISISELRPKQANA